MLKYALDIRAQAVLGASDARAEQVRANAGDYFDLIETLSIAIIAA